MNLKKANPRGVQNAPEISVSSRQHGPGAEAAAVLARAVSLHLEGKRKEALKDLGDAIDSGLQDAELYSARGHVQFELEMFDEAARSYTRLLELSPDHISGIFNLAVCYEKIGRWDEGAQLFDRAVRAQPTRVEAHLSDESSQKSHGDDKKCMLEVRPVGKPALAVTHLAPTLDQAINGAADKLERLLENSFGQVNHPKPAPSPDLV